MGAMSAQKFCRTRNRRGWLGVNFFVPVDGASDRWAFAGEVIERLRQAKKVAKVA